LRPKSKVADEGAFNAIAAAIAPFIIDAPDEVKELIIHHMCELQCMVCDAVNMVTQVYPPEAIKYLMTKKPGETVQITIATLRSIAQYAENKLEQIKREDGTV
jgi:hypothetical protein